jgi:DNA repair protein RadC
MTYQIVSEKYVGNPGRIKEPQDIFNLVKRYQDEQREQFIVITLNKAHEPISVYIASIGTVSNTLVHPREVFVRAIQDMASEIILCHNHPTGSLEPSPEDKEVTERLCSAGKIIGIYVLDHIIFSKIGFKSLRKEGIIKTIEDKLDIQNLSV